MKVRVGDIEIAYDREGEGFPVLLVMGLAVGRIGWIAQMGALSQRYDVACFDNRGIGETTVPEAPWTMDDMVADTLGFADAIGFERFHLAGVSLGGMVCQEIALRDPDRLRSLTLLSTNHGGPDHVPVPADVVTIFGMDGDPTQRLRRTIEATYGRRYREENPHVIEAITEMARSRPTSSGTVMSQALAAAVWSNAGGTADRLGEIRVPTLLMHGTDDEFIPAPNCELIASKIAHAKLIMVPEAGHALVFERADVVNEALLEHLAAADALEHG